MTGHERRRLSRQLGRQLGQLGQLDRRIDRQLGQVGQVDRQLYWPLHRRLGDRFGRPLHWHLTDRAMR